jgi:hypothetical protein
LRAESAGLSQYAAKDRKHRAVGAPEDDTIPKIVVTLYRPS